MFKNKRVLTILIVLAVFSIVFVNNNLANKEDNHSKTEQTESVVEENIHHKEVDSHEMAYQGEANVHNEQVHAVEAHMEEGHGEGHHGADMSPLFFVIISLIIGAATRHLLSKTFLPYTASLLIIGIVLGVINRVGIFQEGGLESIGNAIKWAGNIDPHLILFVFLPTLVFEAAFAMDVYTFKKTSTNSFLLAVPGILVAMFLTAAMVVGIDLLGIGLNNWGWSIALMFGAVISATDPVAVVSLLKDLGASKKLGTLIEGESLLNDGTAIVIFMVFFGALTGTASGMSPIVQFFWVSLGGVVVGVLIGVFTITWVRRVFNDALVEISVIVASAYLTFFIAEHFLHVSGVLGLVAFGLSMAGRGRTRISPEVEHFLHEFWELAAFIANTLIFIIVGMVIAQRIHFTPIDFIVLLIVYIGIHIVRAIVIYIMYPLMKKAGYGLPKKDAYVLWYGALRGAIGLALALVVAGIDYNTVPEVIKAQFSLEHFTTIQNQFLFLTAGIVTLTLLINATTIKMLVNRLGLTKIPAAKALMINNANQYLLQSLKNTGEKFKQDRFMGSADWDEVEHYLGAEEIEEIPIDVKIDTMAETRRRVLEKEKSSYWNQFKEGIIGPNAVRMLTENIKEIIDKGGSFSLADRIDLEESWKTPKLFDKFQSLPIFGKMIENFFFERLSVSYDLAKGFINAQDETLKLINSMQLSQKKAVNEEELAVLNELESEINENRIQGLTFLRVLKKNYPEIYDAISTRQAIRAMLNHELHSIERLLNNGRIDSAEAEKMITRVEENMKRLMEKPPKVKLPTNDEILIDVPWMKDLKPYAFNKAVSYFQKRVYTVGDHLTKAGTASDSIFVIVRGTVKVQKGDEVVALLGPGNTIGELSVLTGNPRSSTIIAVSPATTLRIKFVKIARLLQENPEIKESLWKIAGKRYAENILSGMEPYKSWSRKQLHSWILKGEVGNYDNNELEFIDNIGLLLNGVAFEAGKKRLKEIDAPNILSDNKYGFISDAWVYISPKLK